MTLAALLRKLNQISPTNTLSGTVAQPNRFHDDQNSYTG